MFGGLTHEPAVRLARQLLDIAPGGPDGPLQRVFFADSGSVAVEVALKTAWQAHARRRPDAARRLFTVRGGYHGDTFAPMSVCDPEGGMHCDVRRAAARSTCSRRVRPAGSTATWTTRSSRRGGPRPGALFEAHAEELAAVIVEPVLQGAGGMHV